MSDNDNLAVAPCPLQDPLKHWIEIQLLGEDDQPVPYEAYELVLPNGSKVEGQLDSQGLARVDVIRTQGTCKVRFPELDKDAWEVISPK